MLVEYANKNSYKKKTQNMKQKTVKQTFGWVDGTQLNKRYTFCMVYMLTLGVYWWDPWHTIYSSTMDPSWVIKDESPEGPAMLPKRKKLTSLSSFSKSGRHDKKILFSMDWFEGQMTGNPWVLHVFTMKYRGFLQNFPSSNSMILGRCHQFLLTMLKRVEFSAAVLSWASDRTILPAWACSPTVWSDTCHFDGLDLSGSECGWKE